MKEQAAADWYWITELPCIVVTGDPLKVLVSGDRRQVYLSEAERQRTPDSAVYVCVL